MHVSFDHGFVLQRAVVIRRDGARAVVDALAHFGVTQVGQMVGLGPFGQGRILHLDKVADMHLVAQISAWAQPRKRANQSARAHSHAEFFAIDVGERVDHRARADARVGDHAVRADAHAFAQGNHAFENAVDVNRHILRAGKRAAHIKPRRVRQAHALLHELVRQPMLERPLQLGQLHGAVDTIDLHFVWGNGGHHLNPIVHGEFHNVGQVKLFL